MIVVDQLHLEHTKIILELVEEFDDIGDTLLKLWAPAMDRILTGETKLNPSRHCALIFRFWEKTCLMIETGNQYGWNLSHEFSKTLLVMCSC